MPRPHPLTRKRVWWLLSAFSVVPSEQSSILNSPMITCLPNMALFYWLVFNVCTIALFHWLACNNCVMRCFLWFVQKWTADSAQPRSDPCERVGPGHIPSLQPAVYNGNHRYDAVGDRYVCCHCPTIHQVTCSGCHNHWLLPVSELSSTPTCFVQSNRHVDPITFLLHETIKLSCLQP